MGSKKQKRSASPLKLRCRSFRVPEFSGYCNVGGQPCGTSWPATYATLWIRDPLKYLKNSTQGPTLIIVPQSDHLNPGSLEPLDFVRHVKNHSLPFKCGHADMTLDTRWVPSPGDQLHGLYGACMGPCMALFPSLTQK